MKYTVSVYKNGILKEVRESHAPNHVESLMCFSKGFTGVSFLVVGKTAKYYDCNFKELSGIAVYKTSYSGLFAIALMVGTMPIFYAYTSAKIRNEVFQKCEELMSAKYANQGRQLTTITAYLEETRGSKNTLTAKKTIKESVVSATPTEKQIHSKTAGTSGSASAKYLESGTWSNGSTLSPSKLKQTFLAKVKTLPKNNGWPGVNDYMVEKEGKVVEFHTTKDKKLLVSSDYWYFLPEWLEIKAKVTEDVLAEPVGAIVDLTFKGEYFVDKNGKYYNLYVLEFKEEYYE